MSARRKANSVTQPYGSPTNQFGEGRPPARNNKVTWILIGVIAVLLVALLLVVLLLVNAGDDETSSASASSRTPSATAQPPETSQPGTPPTGMDGNGFVGSHARCDRGDIAVAIGRTAESLVVVCQAVSTPSAFYYRGVRLSDEAESQVDNTEPTPGGYLATSGDVTYTVVADALTIRSGESLLAREPMLEYTTNTPIGGYNPTSTTRATPTASRPPAIAPPAEVRGYPAAPIAGQGVGEGELRFTASRSWFINYDVDCSEMAEQGTIDLWTAADRSLDFMQVYPTAPSGTTRVQSATGPMVAKASVRPDCTWSMSVEYQ
ncbi:hypothetical protein DFJ75_3072 [Williamsia muralis]|uniref:Serine/threonine protein kinase n=1 Tax=Williamsia marianensis TaxID=85044 RepID=A0A495K763_WILMA|nr:hypothetical protein DFJ75_3072 [Williamsia muralis]